MAEEIVMAEVINLLEAEPAACAPAPGPDITYLREKLAISVSTGKCKEEIGVNLTHEQVKRLEDKDVMKYCKRQEAYVGAKMSGTQIENLLAFSTKAIDMVMRSFSTKVIGMDVRIKDTQALKNALKNDYIITKELSNLSGKLALSRGGLLAVANTFLIAANNVELGVDEVDNAKQSPLISE